MRLHSLYALVLLVTFIIIFILSNTKITSKKTLYILIVSLLLSILAYNFNPIRAYNRGNYTDLYRFYKTMDSIRGLRFNNNVTIFKEYNNIFVMKILIYIISNLNNNSLLPFISCFIFYFISGQFIRKICDRYNFSPQKMGLTYFMFICLFNYIMVISNIRCPIASAIFAYTIYYDLTTKHKNKIYLLGYLICCGIHPLFIIFLLFRILIFITNKFTEKILYIIIFFYSSLITPLLNLLNKMTNVSYFDFLSMKTNIYFNSWDKSSNDKIIILTGIIQIIILVYFIINLWKKEKLDDGEYKLFKVTLCFLFFNVGSLFNFVIFQRTTWMLLFFIIFWFLQGEKDYKKKKKFSLSSYELIMIIFSTFCLATYFLTYQYNVLTF